VKKFTLCSGLMMAFAITSASTAAAQAGQPQSGSRINDLIIYDSLTPAKKQMRDFVAELRDSLVRIESVRSRIEKNRKSNTTSVIISQGRELARTCTSGASMLGLTAKRLEPMVTQDPQGDQAMHAYRSALSTLQEELRQCAHFDSLTMATKPLDGQKLENISIAASDAIARHDLIRDGLIKLLGITLPLKGSVGHR
jgi:transposase